MTESKTDVLLLMLMGIVILLMVAIVGLFIRVNQLQREVLAALAPFQLMREPQGLEIGAEAPDCRPILVDVWLEWGGAFVWECCW